MNHNLNNKYEVVIGLEVHAQLLTESKLFCGDSAAFGAAPNTHISAITLAHPGTLPKLNSKAVALAIRLGLSCHCEIEKENFFARKNYFYPDLPRGYQISQHTTPICKGGFIRIRLQGESRNIPLNRIHLEEDAGKSLHDQDPDFTCIDYNRAGVPLVELVTEPALQSGEEAFAFLTELRKIVRYLNVCDGNMEEGSMRCDANISVRLKGDPQLGTKVEIKNLNSIRNVKRAIEIEAERQMQELEAGHTILQQTRSFDADKGISFPLRTKEEANDYRYFPDPDLTPFHLQASYIESIRASLPPMAEELTQELIAKGLSEYDARLLTEEKDVAHYYIELLNAGASCKPAANWINGPIKAWLNEHRMEISLFPISPMVLTELIQLVEKGVLSFSNASGKVLPKLAEHPTVAPAEWIERLNLTQENNEDAIAAVIDQVLAKYPDKVLEYQKGKKGLLALFVGEVMKMTRGKADPRLTNQLVEQRLRH